MLYVIYIYISIYIVYNFLVLVVLQLSNVGSNLVPAGVSATRSTANEIRRVDSPKLEDETASDCTHTFRSHTCRILPNSTSTEKLLSKL